MSGFVYLTSYVVNNLPFSLLCVFQLLDFFAIMPLWIDGRYAHFLFLLAA
jgi:hypothetical protein